MIKGNDGNIILLADSQVAPDNHGRADIWVAKIDTIGNIIWEKSYGGTDNDYALFIRPHPAANSGYVIAGQTTSSDGDVTQYFGDDDVWILKIGEAGDLVWQKTFGGTFDEVANVKVQSNNELLVVVDTWSFDGSFSNGFTLPSADYESKDVWLIKLNEDGNELWKKVYGGNGIDEADIYLSDDQAYLLGASNSFLHGSDPDDGFLWVTKVGPANTIKATAYLDLNSNGVKDASEPRTTDLQLAAVKNSTIVPAQLLSDGTFIMNVDTGNYAVTIYNTGYYTAVPATINSSFATYFNTGSVTFALQPIPQQKRPAHQPHSCNTCQARVCGHLPHPIQKCRHHHYSFR